jgi:hypothetical protein
MKEEIPKKIDYIKMTEEQSDFLNEVKQLRKNKLLGTFVENYPNIKNFEMKKKKEGENLSKYLLWNVIIGSTQDDYVTEFDTQEEDIKKFILSLKK